MGKHVRVKEKLFKGIKDNPSLLGFGCMRLPTRFEDKPDIDEEEAQKMIDYAYQKGVNYFDTAYPYHGGLSETFIGKALKKYPRSSFYLANKMPGWLIESVEDAKRIFNEQLEKCQVDYFDYYLCHALNKKGFEIYKEPGIMDFLYQMKDEGKIKHLGFSFHDTPEVLDDIIHTFDWDFVMIQLNYLDWEFQDAKKQYDIIKNYGVPCLVMEPVRGGTLAQLSESSRALLKEARPDKSIASWAIRYVASLDNVLVILSGMSNQAQTDDNISTLTEFEPLTDEEKLVLNKALKVFLDKNTIPCTDCKYCLPCPEGVNIPGVFKIYNEYALSKFKGQFINRYEAMKESERASSCIACGMCLENCPQRIEIFDRMFEINALYQSLKRDA